MAESQTGTNDIAQLLGDLRQRLGISQEKAGGRAGGLFPHGVPLGEGKEPAGYIGPSIHRALHQGPWGALRGST